MTTGTDRRDESRVVGEGMTTGEYRGITENQVGEDERVRAGEASRRPSERGRTEDTMRQRVDDELSRRGWAGDAKLRRRLAEVLSGAGLEESRIAREVLLLMPQDFLRAYEDLFHRALTLGDEGMGTRNDDKARLGRAVGGRGNAKPAKKRGPVGGYGVKSEKALGEKERIDRTLRKLTRSMHTDGGGTGEAVRCVAKPGMMRMVSAGWEEDGVTQVRVRAEVVGCGKWVEAGWKYCPFCGVQQTKR